MISVRRASLASASGLEELPPLVQRVDNDGEKGGQGLLDHLRTRRQMLTVMRYTPLARLGDNLLHVQHCIVVRHIKLEFLQQSRRSAARASGIE